MQLVGSKDEKSEDSRKLIRLDMKTDLKVYTNGERKEKVVFECRVEITEKGIEEDKVGGTRIVSGAFWNTRF